MVAGGGGGGGGGGAVAGGGGGGGPRKLDELLKNSAVEEVINNWNALLEKSVGDFMGVASRVSEWDEALRQNEAHIKSVWDDVMRLQITQKELNQMVSTVDDVQDEMERELDELEASVDGILASSGSNLQPQDADLEREGMYQMALDVQERLTAMHTTLHGVVTSMNNSFERGAGGNSNSALVLRTMNNHHHLLEHLDRECRGLEDEAKWLSRLLDRVQQPEDKAA